MAVAGEHVAPRRLVLHVDELEALRALAGAPRLPADFRVEPLADPSAGAPDALASLLERGLVSADPQVADAYVVHPSLAADLAVLSAPEVLVETRVAVGAGAARQALRAAHAIAGELGASLVRAEQGTGVELSVFTAVGLGDELRRVVPEADGSHGGERPPAGLVALEALVELPIAAELGGPEVVARIADDLRVTSEQRELALTLARRATGVLQALVTVPARGGGEAWVGEVLWYATDGGWVGVAPEPDDDGRMLARLRPVAAADLGGWLAPLIGQALVEVAR